MAFVRIVVINDMCVRVFIYDLFIDLNSLTNTNFFVVVFVFDDDVFRAERCRSECVSDVWSFNGHKYALTRTLTTVNVLPPLSCTVSIGWYMQFYQLYAIQLLVPFSPQLSLSNSCFLFFRRCNKLFIYCNQRPKPFRFFLSFSLLCHSQCGI